jgi:hypothetical protein
MRCRSIGHSSQPNTPQRKVMSETAEVRKGRSLRRTPHHGLGCTRHGCHCVCILMCLSASDVLCIMVKRIDMTQ